MSSPPHRAGKERRKNEAAERAKDRKDRGDLEQLKLIEERRGESKKEKSRINTRMQEVGHEETT